MSCGHDGCTCGPATDDATTTSLPTLEPQTGEPPAGCCGGHDHTESGHDCGHHHDGQPA